MVDGSLKAKGNNNLSFSCMTRFNYMHPGFILGNSEDSDASDDDESFDEEDFGRPGKLLSTAGEIHDCCERFKNDFHGIFSISDEEDLIEDHHVSAVSRGQQIDPPDYSGHG